MLPNRICMFVTFVLVCLCTTASALVKYDQGRRMVNGIQLLQDTENSFEYYYIPQFPRMATKSDSSFEFLCIKYVGADREQSGGLFHALIEFTLPEDVLEELQAELEKQSPNARIVGPVPLMDALENGQEGVGSFEIISGVLSNTEGEESFTRSVITSGHAPLMPGSKSAVAAILNQEGATLLWESLQSPTSDVSVSISAYYEAVVKSYNATVSAEMQTIYEHFSKLHNIQQGFTKRQLRKIMDELNTNGKLKIEVFDRSQGIGVSSEDMDGILQIVTDKITELMFNAETGWSKEPDRETAVEQGQIKGRQKRGFFGRLFGGSGNQAYYSDDQFVLKKRTDIRTRKFFLNLGKSTTIKVPVRTSGNLGGLYNEFHNDEKYFRIVDMRDAAFQRREIQFIVDKDYVDSFSDLVNFVSVSFRKKFGGNQADFTQEINFPYHLVRDGQLVQEISYPRLGIRSSDWLDYEYKVSWGIRDQESVPIPSNENEWIKSSDAAIQLSPPFKKRIIEIDADRTQFQELGINSATVDFAVVLNDKPMKMCTVILRANDAEPTKVVSLYHDENEESVYKVTWYSARGKLEKDIELLQSDYLPLIPPSPDDLEHTKN